MTQFVLQLPVSVKQQVLICGCRFSLHLSVEASVKQIRLVADIKDGSQLQVLEPEGH